MTKELKEKLEKGLLDAGLDKGLLAFINIEKEEDVQGAISNLLKLKTPQKSVEELLKDKEIQSEIDRRISEAKKSWDSKLSEPPKPIEGNETLEEKLAKLLEAKLAPLTEELNGFKQNRTRDSKLSQARKALESSKIPVKNRDFYLELYNPDSETPLEEWVKISESKHETYVQSLADSTQLAGQSPKFIDNVAPTTEDLDAMLDKMGK